MSETLTSGIKRFLTEVLKCSPRSVCANYIKNGVSGGRVIDLSGFMELITIYCFFFSFLDGGRNWSSLPPKTSVTGL